VRSVERGDLATRLQLILLDTSGERPITELSRDIAYAPAWSPDGRQITFARWRGRGDRYSSEIVVASLDGGQERVLRRVRLDRRLSAVGEPAWSPDGARIAYTLTALDRSYHFRSSLYVIGAGGGAPELLAGDAGDAAWSPDGSRIAFSSTRDRNGEWCGSDECFYNGELYVMDADGSNPVRLTHNRGDDRSPAWSPDGRRIAFASNRNNRGDPPGQDMEIYTIGADGECLTWLTNGAPQSGDPAWRPAATAPLAPTACGATPRPPRMEVEPEGVRPRRGDPAVWLGERHGNVLLSHAEIARDGRSRRSYFFHYDDCARFRLRDCGRGLQLQVASVCSRQSVLAGFDRPNWLHLGRSFAARGVLFAELGAGRARVIAGNASVTLYAESGPGRSRPQLLSAVSALRPFGGRSRELAAPALPRSLLRSLRRTQRAYRRSGSLSGAAVALGLTPDRRATAAASGEGRRLAPARARDPLCGMNRLREPRGISCSVRRFGRG
jgi:dipeptidyl aminopeptidase/acylaminoacyl peptidase